ncbi:predicted protein [Sclerotinia sclerotiorum 1980 UF-70]|uniref:Uncharacterized protein n=1 Tax=Sclerotinia sclerotiorum (strain ATCC 18683 / 1980 / Ss-1) TaxID=665079 RepID=A7ENN6_SCLS1|nr:predicted protein [Sclerotinia sclerotiorum 1980 UF-70]EDO04452.1 predicted protein [Sclerotinia sclerotiorum 1980 UF-70]
MSCRSCEMRKRTTPQLEPFQIPNTKQILGVFAKLVGAARPISREIHLIVFGFEKLNCLLRSSTRFSLSRLKFHMIF